MSNNILYNKQFTGEIPPLVINASTPFNPSDNFDFHELPLIKWRDIVKKHLPSNANLATVECELKLEYLHVDYLIPSRGVVPSSAIPTYGRRETDNERVIKTLEFKNKYNRIGDYAFEYRLLKKYDPLYTLDSLTPYVNAIPYNVELNNPISDLIYNNRLPGFIDLMPYLIKNGTLIFADIKQELSIQIIPKLEGNDLLIFGGGYSGSVTFELLPQTIEITESQSYSVGNTPVKVLELNSKRLGFYLRNNGTKDIYYSFNNVMPNDYMGLKLKPNETLLYEDKKLIVNNSLIDPGDSRHILGLPLWVRSSDLSLFVSVAIEEISYT